MKKLMPIFLAATFMLTSSTVFANSGSSTQNSTRQVSSAISRNTHHINTSIDWLKPSNVNITLIEMIHNEGWPMSRTPSITATRKLEPIENLLSVQITGNDNVVHFIRYTELPNLFEQVVFWSNLQVNWNSETDTVEISNTHRWFGEEIEPQEIVEPIDIDSINLDEWVNISFLSTSIRDSHYSFSFSNDLLFVLMVSGNTYNIFDTFEIEEIFTSVIGCNTADIRAIQVNDMFEIKINVQDLLRSGLFTEEAILEAIELTRTYGTPREQLFTMIFYSFKEEIESGIFSDEDLEEILAAIELMLLNQENRFEEISVEPTL